MIPQGFRLEIEMGGCRWLVVGWTTHAHPVPVVVPLGRPASGAHAVPGADTMWTVVDDSQPAAVDPCGGLPGAAN